MAKALHANLTGETSMELVGTVWRLWLLFRMIPRQCVKTGTSSWPLHKIELVASVMDILHDFLWVRESVFTFSSLHGVTLG
jgi:hypothetical protein